jgi:hypothetical protein
LQRPDLFPQGIDNEDVIVLPEHLFINLIDIELQKKIANAKNMDYDTAEAVKEYGVSKTTVCTRLWTEV